MATLVFPTGLFGFLSKDIDIERQTLTGGTALSGEQDVVSTDGGGRVFAAFGDGNAVDRSTVLAWRALLTNLEDGVTPIIVPFCDVRHTPYGAMHRVPHSDGTPFSDDSLYRGADDPVAETTEAGRPARDADCIYDRSRAAVARRRVVRNRASDERVACVSHCVHRRNRRHAAVPPAPARSGARGHVA